MHLLYLSDCNETYNVIWCSAESNMVFLKMRTPQGT